MRTLIVAIVLGLVSHPVAAGPKKSAPHLTNVPGVGARLVIPPGFIQGPLGAYFIDPSGETFVSFSLNRKDFESDMPNFVFPGLSEPFKNAHLSGTLRSRDRSRDRGATSDGWSLIVKGEKLALAVEVNYQGKDPRRIRELRNVFSELSWDERRADMEKAFGARFALPGLQIDSNALIGNLSYTDRGLLGGFGRTLFVYAQPVVPMSEAKRRALLPQLCQNFPAGVDFRQTHAGQNLIERNGILACDAWLADTSKTGSYQMLLLMPNGAVLTASATGGSPEQLRADLLAIQVTRAVAHD